MKILARYQRFEKALQLALMEMAVMNSEEDREDRFRPPQGDLGFGLPGDQLGLAD